MFTKNILSKAWMLILVASLGMFSCKKKDDTPGNNNNNNNNNNQGKKYLLQIEQGARVIQSVQSITYTVRLVDSNGNVTTAAGVSWTSSNTDVATISNNGEVTPRGVGGTTITAQVTKDGSTYSTSVPLRVEVTQAFVVNPAALILFEGEEVPLTPVMVSENGVNVGVNNFTYSIETGASFITLTGSLVKGKAPGYAEVKVTANTSSGNPYVIVPIQVLGVPQVEVPVVRVEVRPASNNIDDIQIFRGENLNYIAKAFNANNQQVNETFTWSILDPNIASVDANGKVTGLSPGETKVQAMAKGVIGQADVIVTPDTVVVVTPFYTQVAAGSTRQFTAKVYNQRTQQQLTGVPITWETPNYPAPFDMFNIGTVNSNGLLTVNQNATPGMVSFVAASITGKPEYGSVGTVMIDPFGGGGNCGQDNPNVASIRINNGSNITASFSAGTVQVSADALNSSGGVVSGVTFNYSSSDTAIFMVDSNGVITPVAPGTATLTVCIGSKSATATVNVTF